MNFLQATVLGGWDLWRFFSFACYFTTISLARGSVKRVIDFGSLKGDLEVLWNIERSQTLIRAREGGGDRFFFLCDDPTARRWLVSFLISHFSVVVVGSVTRMYQ